MKLQKPWLRALKERAAGITNTPKESPTVDLTPKRMKDSYHSLVSHPRAPFQLPLTLRPPRSFPSPATNGSSTPTSTPPASSGSARSSKTSMPSPA